MPRSRPPGRLADVIAAASRLFAANGYARTQMADVARQLRMSAGALYGYAQSKDALFYWCIETAVDPTVLAKQTLPLPTVTPAQTIERAQRHLDTLFDLNGPTARALCTEDPDDVAAELRAVIGELYDATFRTRLLQDIIERSAQDLPDLFDAFYGQMRQPAIDFVAAYLQMRVDHGYFRPLVDVRTTARLIIETQAWFARHRRGDPDSADIDDATARATVIDMLTHALLPPR